MTQVVHFEGLMEKAMEKGLVTTRQTDKGPVTNVLCKPNVKAFEVCLEICGIDDPTSVLFCDDSARNIAGAKKLGTIPSLLNYSYLKSILYTYINPTFYLRSNESLRTYVGMKTCIVGRSEPCEGADYAVMSLHELPQVNKPRRGD